MPALAKSSVGSSCGTTLEEGTKVWPCFLQKKSMNCWRISLADGILADLLGTMVKRKQIQSTKSEERRAKSEGNANKCLFSLGWTFFVLRSSLFVLCIFGLRSVFTLRTHALGLLNNRRQDADQLARFLDQRSAIGIAYEFARNEHA